MKPSTLRSYADRYPAALPSLAAWLTTTTRASWSSIVDVRAVYRHADAAVVGSGRTVTIFNIAGNHYRLITAVHYNTGLVFVRDFLTHADYDKQFWKGRH